MRFYDQLAREIDTACASGRIQCGPPRATLMPVFRWRYLKDTLRDSLNIADILLTMGDTEVGVDPSEGTSSGIATFADIVGGVYPAKPTQLSLKGWAASPSGEPQLSLKALPGGQAQITIDETTAPDVTQRYPGHAFRSHDGLSTFLRTYRKRARSGAGTMSLDQLHAGEALSTPQLRLFFDSASVGASAPATAKRLGLQLQIAKAIASCYARGVPTLFVLALCGFILALIRMRSRPISPALAGLLAASLAAIATRVVLLAYMDVTSMLAANILYASPASPFVLIFTVVGCWCLVHSLVPKRRLNT